MKKKITAIEILDAMNLKAEYLFADRNSENEALFIIVQGFLNKINSGSNEAFEKLKTILVGKTIDEAKKLYRDRFKWRKFLQ